jgi:adenine/guanine phosphoribosyltransferase-like PRPP-binding protein
VSWHAKHNPNVARAELNFWLKQFIKRCEAGSLDIVIAVAVAGFAIGFSVATIFFILTGGGR